MNRRGPLLNGLAIICVILSHAASWAQAIMASPRWYERFQMLPGSDQAGGVMYYLLTASRPLMNFSVPAFFFVTGLFLAFANRGTQAPNPFKMIGTRLVGLLIPFGFWYVVFFWGDFILFASRRTSLLPYVWEYVVTNPKPHLFFVPEMCYFLLVSPLLVPLVKKHGQAVLITAAVVEIGLTGLLWLDIQGWLTISLPVIGSVQDWFPHWRFPRWVFFGSLGMLAGFYSEAFKAWLVRYKKVLLTGTIILALVEIAQELLTRAYWNLPVERPMRLTELAYGLCFILMFLSFSIEKTRTARPLFWISNRVFGIYLLHYSVMEYLVRGAAVFFPPLLAYQVLVQPVLIAAGIGLPVLLMALVQRSPLSRYYRYFFG